MTRLLLALALTAAAGALTYLCCVRPVRRDRGTTTGTAATGMSPRGVCCPPDEIDRQLAAAREEIVQLRGQQR